MTRRPRKGSRGQDNRLAPEGRTPEAEPAADAAMPLPDGRPGKKYASSVDVARLAGVSQSAVSRTYTGVTYVSEQTRRRVLEAARKLDYRPSMIPRIMSTHRSNLVAIVMGGFYNPFYTMVLEQFTVKLQESGHQVLLVHVESGHALDDVIPRLASYRVDAIVSALAVLSPNAADALAKLRVPVISFNTALRNEWVSPVSCDNVGAARAIAELLVERGARSFGFISGPTTSHASAGREKGFTERLRELTQAPVRIARADYRYEGGFAAALDMFAGPERTGGVVLRQRSHRLRRHGRPQEGSRHARPGGCHGRRLRQHPRRRLGLLRPHDFRAGRPADGRRGSRHPGDGGRRQGPAGDRPGHRACSPHRAWNDEANPACVGTKDAPSCNQQLETRSMSRFRLGCQTYTWEMLGDRWAGTTDDLIRAIADAGYEGIEITDHMIGPYAGRAEAFARTLADHGLTLVAFAWASATGFTVPAAREADIELARSWLAFVSRFPGATLSLGSATSTIAGSIRSRLDCAARIYNTVGRHGAALGVPVAFHPELAPRLSPDDRRGLCAR